MSLADEFSPGWLERDIKTASERLKEIREIRKNILENKIKKPSLQEDAKVSHQGNKSSNRMAD